MSGDHPAVVYCKRELETYRKLLADYKSGRRKSGESTDGHSWTDTTGKEIALLEGKIRELEKLLQT
jgi:hypothetical protein